MNNPTFSIIVPIYNISEDYFHPCIESLVGQKNADCEIILVDDGSHEACAVLCDETAAKYSQVRVIHQKNQGVSAARNNGILAAQGDWILFVDADDWIDIDSCARIHEQILQSNADLVMFNGLKEFGVRTEILHMDLENKKCYSTENPETREWLYRKAMQPKQEIGTRSSHITYCWDKAYRRTFLIENKLRFPVGIPKSEDKIFILRCFERMNGISYLDDQLYHYRQNDASICHRFSSSADHDRQIMADKLYEIAQRMNREIAELKKQSQYDLIIKD